VRGRPAAREAIVASASPWSRGELMMEPEAPAQTGPLQSDSCVFSSAAPFRPPNDDLHHNGVGE
jgi:hypothetical protein